MQRQLAFWRCQERKIKSHSWLSRRFEKQCSEKKPTRRLTGKRHMSSRGVPFVACPVIFGFLCSVQRRGTPPFLLQDLPGRSLLLPPAPSSLHDLQDPPGPQQSPRNFRLPGLKRYFDAHPTRPFPFLYARSLARLRTMQTCTRAHPDTWTPAHLQTCTIMCSTLRCAMRTRIVLTTSRKPFFAQHIFRNNYMLTPLALPVAKLRYQVGAPPSPHCQHQDVTLCSTLPLPEIDGRLVRQNLTI